MRLLLALTLVSCSALIGLAQATTTGQISGSVRDQTGALLPSVVITATNQETGTVRSGTTDSEGAFVLRLLRPGTYRVETSASGFKAIAISNAQVTLGLDTRVDMQLEVSTVNELVTIRTEEHLIDRASTDDTRIIDNRKIHNLPINQRNFLTFAVTTPGVVIERGPQSGGAPTSGISINGQSPRYNNIVVDGLDNNDRAVGSVRSTFPQEAVQEYEVIRAPYEAEYGRTVGGVVNIVTRSGGNILRGSGFYFFRNDKLAASNGLANSRAPFNQGQFGSSIGGPLNRNKIFYFGALERLSVSDSNVVTISDQAIATIRAKGFDVQNGVVSFDRDLTTGIFRVDFAKSARKSIAVRCSFSKEDNGNQQPFGGQVAKSAGGLLHANDQACAANWISVLSPALSNEFRGLVGRRVNNLDSLDSTGGVAVIIQGVARFGMRQTLPQPRYTRQQQWFEGLTWTHGRTTYKVGVDYARLFMSGSLPLFVNGQFQFNAQPSGLTAVESFVTNKPSLFIQAFGDSSKRVSANDLGAFIEVKWNVRRRFVLSGGVRYELEEPVSPFPTDSNNWAPRFSFSWAPADDFQVRGGIGRFYGISSAAALFSVGISNGINLHTITRTIRGGPSPVEPWLLENHRFANEQQAGASTVPQTILKAGNFDTAYSDQASLGIEKVLHNKIILSVDYVGTIGRSILIARDINPITQPPTGRPNAAFANIYSYESSGNSWYRSLSMGAESNPRSSLRISAFYTYAKAEDTYTDWRTEFQPQDPFNLKDERGPSVHTPRHRITVTGIYSTHGVCWWRRGWTVAMITEYNSGLPFNQLAGFDRNLNGESLSDRPPGVGRNRGKLPDSGDADLRIARRFSMKYAKFDVIFDAFNVFNQKNVLEIQNVASQPGYGTQPLRLADPRRLQLGARIQF